MKVLLVDPPDLFLKGQGLTRQVQPLGLAYVGAYLAREGHEVRFLLPDTRAYKGDDPWGELRSALEAESPDVVGLTAVTAMMPSALRMAQEVKAVDPTTVTVLGGTHVSSNPAQSLRQGHAIDYAIGGEGEETMAELLERLEQHRSGARRTLELDSVKGLVWREGEAIRTNPPRPSIQDLDSLPMPMRDGLVWPEDIQPAFYQAMITLRGCPYRCIYCAVPSSNDRRTRYRSPDHVVDEIALLRERYAIPYLFFHDSVFTLNRARTEAICHRMQERGQVLPFACQTRTDRVDGALLDLLKASGCHQIFFGIESGDVRSLKRIRKKMTLESIRKAVEMVKERQIRCTGFFMVGLPWEDETLIRQTADFACDLGLDAVSLFSATPLPGTELWDMAGGDHMPDSIDFTRPQVNLTGLTSDAYAELFSEVKAQIDTYNQRQMMQRLAGLHIHQHLPEEVRRSWLDG
ncbi:MAG: radical SAM protein [Myxococcota bacterium]